MGRVSGKSAGRRDGGYLVFTENRAQWTGQVRDSLTFHLNISAMPVESRRLPPATPGAAGEPH
jgi:hypothetical protein